MMALAYFNPKGSNLGSEGKKEVTDKALYCLKPETAVLTPSL